MPTDLRRKTYDSSGAGMPFHLAAGPQLRLVVTIKHKNALFGSRSNFPTVLRARENTSFTSHNSNWPGTNAWNLFAVTIVRLLENNLKQMDYTVTGESCFREESRASRSATSLSFLFGYFTRRCGRTWNRISREEINLGAFGALERQLWKWNRFLILWKVDTGFVNNV